MQTIQQILEEKRKIVNKEKVRKYAEAIPQEYFILKDKVNSINGDIKEILLNSEPEQIDSHEENRVVANIEGFKNERIGNMRYLIQLIAYFNNGSLFKSHIVGMLNGSNNCYIRETFGKISDKIDNKLTSTSSAKELF